MTSTAAKGAVLICTYLYFKYKKDIDIKKIVAICFLCTLQFITLMFVFLGRIHSGMSVVKRIGLVETDKNDRPVDDVKVVRGYIRSH
jgi:hypothetical protein